MLRIWPGIGKSVFVDRDPTAIWAKLIALSL
jgi:hypothetical protein